MNGMRRVRPRVLAALVVVGAVLFVGTRPPGSTQFCHANGLAGPDGALYEKNDDCEFIDKDGNVVVGPDGHPIRDAVPSTWAPVV
jgi:hypothetical protein